MTIKIPETFSLLMKMRIEQLNESPVWTETILSRWDSWVNGKGFLKEQIALKKHVKLIIKFSELFIL